MSAGRLGNVAAAQVNRRIVGLAKARIQTGNLALCTAGALLAGTVSDVLAAITERLEAAPKTGGHSGPARHD